MIKRILQYPRHISGQITIVVLTSIILALALVDRHHHHDAARR